jgi:DNA-binding response OmpR family regulator
MAHDLILVIEDDEDLLEDLPKVLRTYNFNVSSTTDYKEAVNQVQEGSIGAVILDMKMPPSADMNSHEADDGRLTGVVVCRRLREVSRSIPIVFVTSLTDPKAHALAREAGANDVLQKPVYPDEIVQRLNRLLK